MALGVLEGHYICQVAAPCNSAQSEVWFAAHNLFAQYFKALNITQKAIALNILLHPKLIHYSKL